MVFVSLMCAVCSSRITSHRYCPSTLSLSPACSSLCSARRSHCSRTAVIGCVFLLRLFDPCGVLSLAYHTHHDRHEGVILAAQLGALAIIDAFALGLEPSLVDATGYRVD